MTTIMMHNTYSHLLTAILIAVILYSSKQMLLEFQQKYKWIENWSNTKAKASW